MTMAQLWGGRFTKQTDQLVFDFNASITFDKRLFHEDVTGSIVHATMLAKQGILTEEEKKSIIEGLTGILRLLWALERFVVPLNRVFFRKSSYKREERSRKVIIPSRMRVTGESKRTPSPRRFGIFLTLRMFCLFQ